MKGKKTGNKQTAKKVAVKQVKKIQDGTSIQPKMSLNKPHEDISSGLLVTTTTPSWCMICKRTAGVLAVLASIATILILFIPTPITEFLFPNNPQDNPPKYYSGSDWLQMDAAGAILEGTSYVQLYADSISEVWEESDTTYYDGATLIALFSNQDEHEKIITKFRVYANDIVENLSPDLHFNFWQDELTDPISCDIYNNGWGETGEIRITFSSIQPVEGFNDDLAVDVYLQDGACMFWELDSVKPGCIGNLPLLSGQDFVVEYKAHPKENFPIYYSVAFIVEAPEQNYATTMEFPLEIGPDYVRLFSSGLGGGDARNYVVWIDTSSPTYSAEYPVYQRLPGNEVVCIPMLIVPEKSCTMSVKIEFETLEGEIIQATPLNHANFVIPYYENQWMYVDGNLLDWDSIEGKVVTCLPFSGDPGDVNVAFPFVNSSMMIPSEAVS